MSKMSIAALAVLTLTTAGCASNQAARANLVKAPPRCPDQTVEVYFEPWSAEVTAEGRAVIEAAATATRGCVVKSVQVVGLADATGSPQANLELSKRRAQSVSVALAASGLPAAEFSVSAAGQAGATTAQGAAAPLRRRADITLHLAPS